MEKSTENDEDWIPERRPKEATPGPGPTSLSSRNALRSTRRSTPRRRRSHHKQEEDEDQTDSDHLQNHRNSNVNGDIDSTESEFEQETPSVSNTEHSIKFPPRKRRRKDKNEHIENNNLSPNRETIVIDEDSSDMNRVVGAGCTELQAPHLERPSCIPLESENVEQSSEVEHENDNETHSNRRNQSNHNQRDHIDDDSVFTSNLNRNVSARSLEEKRNSSNTNSEGHDEIGNEGELKSIKFTVSNVKESHSITRMENDVFQVAGQFTLIPTEQYQSLIRQNQDLQLRSIFTLSVHMVCSPSL